MDYYCKIIACDVFISVLLQTLCNTTFKFEEQTGMCWNSLF